jgi:lysophospholipase L1-like esterase
VKHPSDKLAVHRTRGPMPNFRRALSSGTVRVGFLGGSITDQKTGTRWPEGFAAWLTAKWPDVRWILENAAIGATGSDLAVFRAQRDIIERDCDLVFVEYAVNDNGTPPERRARAREGVLRQLLASGRRDVMLVYTFMREFHGDMEDGRLPASVADFEILADHYGLNSVWVGLQAWREVREGLMRWEEWLPDGLHPEHRGSQSYAQSVMVGVEKARASKAKTKARPVPLDPLCWEKPRVIPFAEIERAGPWTERRWGALNWIDQVLFTTAPGATLRGKFRGRNLVAGFDFGSASSEIRWRIDGGAWQTSVRDRPSWCGAGGWYRPLVLAENLKPGSHTFELETLHGNTPECTGCTTCIPFIAAV